MQSIPYGYACAVGKLHADLQPAGARCAASSVGAYGPKGTCECPLQYSADKSSRRMLVYGPGVTASPPNRGWTGPKFSASERLMAAVRRGLLSCGAGAL
jgi:hypothetical protein